MQNDKHITTQKQNFASAIRHVFTDPFDYRVVWKFVLINAILGTLVCLSFCPQCFLSIDGLIRVSDNWLYSFLISMLLSGGITAIFRFSNEKFPWLEKPGKRLCFDVIAVTAYSFVVSLILATVFSLYVWDHFKFDNIGWADLIESTKMPTSIALGITIFLTSRSFLTEWKQSAIEAERMKTQQMEGQYMSLKNQLNPHFLFNSLNVLSNLVYENADQANAFIEKLSRIYRYVLDVQNEELVALKQELDFAKSYFELLSIRFGEKFTYSIEVTDVDEVGIPPLSLQLLIENAVKHNKLSNASPLEISVIQEGDSLLIRNRKQLREVAEPSSGVGLKNIKERYAFLSSREVEITENGFFEVKIPLLKMEANG